LNQHLVDILPVCNTLTLAMGFCTSFASSGASWAYEQPQYEAAAKSATIHATAAAAALLDPIDHACLS
jgi:hypothetical protein